MNFNSAVFEASYGRYEQIPACETLEIAISGRSNVGKSSLINKLFGRKQLARVSSMPGKTTTINFFRVEDVRFADLPGYGYAKVSQSEKKRWSELIGSYLSSDRNIALVFQLVDMRHPPTRDDLVMIDFLIEAQMPFVVVLTKADKLNKGERAARLEALQHELPYADQITMVATSSETGEGIETLREIVEDIALEEDEEGTGGL